MKGIVPVDLPLGAGRVEFVILPYGEYHGFPDPHPMVKVDPISPGLRTHVFTNIDELRDFDNPYTLADWLTR